MSHPVWVRGLKLIAVFMLPIHSLVAPRVGAWIETCVNCLAIFDEPVAPRVGAWIETQLPYIKISHIQSHPVWVRGLKPLQIRRGTRFSASHPVWVRGLKHSQVYHTRAKQSVAPRVGAWIETFARKQRY